MFKGSYCRGIGIYEVSPAVSDEENYYVKSGLVVYDTDSAYSVFESAAVRSIENHDRYVRVKCSSDEVYDWVYSEIFGGGTENGSIFDILKTASEKMLWIYLMFHIL